MAHNVICTWCGRDMSTSASCTVGTLHRDGAPVPMIPFGREPGCSAAKRCGDCGVQPGGFHHLGCDMQRCARCGGQMISCGCRFDEDGPDDPDLDGGGSWPELPPARDFGPIHITRPRRAFESDPRLLDELERDANGCPTQRLNVGGQEVIVHYDDLPDSDLTDVRGIPVTTPLRTVIDVAATLEPSHLRAILADCLGRGLFSIADALDRLRQPDMASRPGAAALRRALGEP